MKHQLSLTITIKVGNHGLFQLYRIGFDVWFIYKPHSTAYFTDRTTPSSGSSRVLALPASSGEQNAYIPLTYAKDCLQKVLVDDNR